MNCDQCESRLFDFHEGKLSPDDATGIDAHLQDCPDCTALLNDIWQVSLAASRWHDQSVPSVRGAKYLPEKRSWQTSLALVASFLALVMVVTDAHIVTGDGDITLAFGRSDLASQRDLAEFQQVQARIVDQGISKLTAQQVASNQLMLRTLLSTSREERRQELTTLVSYWSETQAIQAEEMQESLRFLIASQAEDEKDIRQLSSAFQQISQQRSRDM